MLLLLSSTICWLLRIRLLLEPASRDCSGNGSLDPCGQCICDKNFFGNKCECFYSETLKWGPQNTSASLALCTPDDVPDANICSGRGDCRCGYCRCNPISKSRPDERYSGQYCECDDFSCPYHNDKLCGGHGRCVCGKCECHQNYIGEACECSTSQDMCKSSNGRICNGQGSCICGKCECDAGSMYSGPTCEDCTPIVEKASYKCNNRGSLNACDQCICDQGYYGESCECDDDLSEYCISPHSGIVCSGRGDCVCGMCMCHPRRLNSAQRYSGRYCDCDDYSCSYHNNLLCGGHGVCQCGECVCQPGYTGEACDCPTAPDTCMAGNGQICNGQGKCVCGTCICDRDSYFKGRHCEECPTCPGKCRQYKECIRCRVFNTGTYSKEECSEKCPLVYLVDLLDENEIKNDEDTNLCKFIDDDDDLHFFFSYTYTDSNEIRLTAQTIKIGRRSSMIFP